MGGRAGKSAIICRALASRKSGLQRCSLLCDLLAALRNRGGAISFARDHHGTQRKGRRLIAASIIRRIEELLRRKVSQRTIAGICKVSRATVQQVSAGRVTSKDRERIERIVESPDKLDERVRCPKCGSACVEVPCRRCFTRRMIAGGHLPPTSPEELPTVGLDLQPEEKARYAEVRRLRRERGRRRA